MTKEATDYNAKLAQDYADIRAKVRGGMLPLVARIPAIDKAVSAYVLAQDAHYEELRRKAEEEGGDASTAVPIQLRDATALHRMADLVLHEELTWSHPDKMSIVEYPVMSDRQRSLRDKDRSLLGEIEYGDRQHNARKKTFYMDDQGGMRVNNPRMANEDTGVFDDVIEMADLSAVVEKAKLTARQKEALSLVYLSDMTQGEVSEYLGVGQDVISRHITSAINKIRDQLTKD